MRPEGDEVPAGVPWLPDMWLSAWSRPWGVFDDWNSMLNDWHGSWRNWLNSVATMPAAWMPALAAERKEQPAAIDFFLPWLPRIEAQFMTPDHSDGDAVRVMLRAALPGGLGGEGDWLEVDATVRRRRNAKENKETLDANIVEALPAEATPAAEASADKPKPKVAPRSRKTG
jgi:hypothetical protein